MSVTDAKRREKTKAKQRYLRRKRDRRKLKAKASKPRKAASNDQENDPDPESASVAANEAPTKIFIQSPSVREHSLPPSKKRQWMLEENSPGDDAMELDTNTEVYTGAVRSSEAWESALPTFSPPVLPDTPLRTDLELQGLDQALVEAELVDSSLVARLPSEGEQDHWTGLSGKMKRRLEDLGIQELFAVQAALLPFLLKNNSQNGLYSPYEPPRDVCVSAPTGSGKTLAFAIPIVEILSARIVTRLRALIVLPTRDLVMQVRETFQAIAKGRGLKIGTATGQHSFAHEQFQLVAEQTPHIRGGSSKVDILICTPGRLMDHLNGTTNFSLQHLRFLVIDEADRLLAQSFQDWLARVLMATRPYNSLKESPSSTSNGYPFPDCVSPEHVDYLPLPELPSTLTEIKDSSCQKLLFSATLTRDPGKIAALELREPKYFIVQDRMLQPNETGSARIAVEIFSMPITLREHMVVCESSLKPLIFFYLVHFHSVTSALVFTKSAESTTRLVQLFAYFEESRASSMAGGGIELVVRPYSSDLTASERKTILEKFKTQEIQILVCSDLISRGIDIHHVSHVVSYDAPIDIRKYVHRVGRTARAGRIGDAWTLVEEQEALYFKRMMQEANHLDKVKRLKVSTKETKCLAPHYEAALKKLKEVYTREPF